MRDDRWEKLAHVLIHHSCEVQKGDKVLIEAIDCPDAFLCLLIEQVARAGGIPFAWREAMSVKRVLMRIENREIWEAMARADLGFMKEMDAYIAIRGSKNVSEFADVSTAAQRLYENTYLYPVHLQERVNRKRWVILRWPTPSMAQLAGTSTEKFAEFFYEVCTLDYAKMGRAITPLVERLNAAKEIHLQEEGGTDITFSVEGINALPCFGKRNIPDGEVFTAPVRDSINGVIQYNVPSLYRGQLHNNVRFRFEKGRIIEATSSNTEHLNSVLDSDEGARYIGEFAIGLNPYCVEPMNDILFDEKMAGSIHLTPGNAYERADNGNRSSIHWDLILKGGELFFDGELIRKGDQFLPEDLRGLNPDRLKA